MMVFALFRHEEITEEITPSETFLVAQDDVRMKFPCSSTLAIWYHPKL